MPTSVTAGSARPLEREVARPGPAPSHRRLALALILTAAFMVVLDKRFTAVNLQTWKRPPGPSFRGASALVKAD